MLENLLDWQTKILMRLRDEVPAVADWLNQNPDTWHYLVNWLDDKSFIPQLGGNSRIPGFICGLALLQPPCI